MLISTKRQLELQEQNKGLIEEQNQLLKVLSEKIDIFTNSLAQVLKKEITNFPDIIEMDDIAQWKREQTIK